MPMASRMEKELEAEARRRHIPLNVKMELLPVCNLNCRMCYIRTDMETVRRQGGLIEADRWLALAREMRDAGTYFLLLTGGEVLLYPEFRRLYAGLHAMGFSITLNSNATLIDEDTADFLAKLPPQLMSLSLYGASDATYEALCGQKGMFARVDRAIRLLLARGIRGSSRRCSIPSTSAMRTPWPGTHANSASSMRRTPMPSRRCAGRRPRRPFASPRRRRRCCAWRTRCASPARSALQAACCRSSKNTRKPGLSPARRSMGLPAARAIPPAGSPGRGR